MKIVIWKMNAEKSLFNILFGIKAMGSVRIKLTLRVLEYWNAHEIYPTHFFFLFLIKNLKQLRKLCQYSRNHIVRKTPRFTNHTNHPDLRFRQMQNKISLTRNFILSLFVCFFFSSFNFFQLSQLVDWWILADSHTLYTAAKSLFFFFHLVGTMIA